MFPTNDPRYKDLRRKLRRDQTPAEALFWLHVRNKQTGYKFYRQYGIGRYIVDFCCPSKHLVIELDGGHHAKPLEKLYDEERTYDLNQRGFQVLRFWNTDVMHNIEGCIDEILMVLND